MIEKNNTWKLIDRPTHKKTIGVKWVYRTKLNSDGSVNKHKASWLSKVMFKCLVCIFQRPLHL